MIDPKPTLSIVITSYTLDRLNDITELLDSLNNQTRNPDEIIVVVEKSGELFEQIKRYAEEKPLLNTRVVFNNGEPGLSAGRNLGIKEATGDIIAFIDDDALPSPDWAEEMVKTYQDDSVIGVTGPAIPLWEDESMAWFPEEFYWIIGCTAWYTDNRVNGIAPMRNVWGMNMSFRREAFDSAGVFSNNIGGIQGRRLHGEEVELSLRVKGKTGKRIVYNPRVKVQHKVSKSRLSIKSIARSSYWIGHTRPMLKRLYPQTEADTNFLDIEYRLLKRILTRLFPSILKDIFKNPVSAWHRFWVMVIALSSVAFGYLSYLFQSLFGHGKTLAGEEKMQT